MKILLDEDRMQVLKLLAKAQEEESNGDESPLYDLIGREYAKDLVVTINALEQLTVDAQRVVVACVLQAGGELQIDLRHVLEATQTKLDQDVRIHRDRDMYLSVFSARE